MAAVRQADEIAEERRVDPLAAHVRGQARQLEQLVDVRLRQVILRGLFLDLGGELRPRLLEPSVHGGSLDSRRSMKVGVAKESSPEEPRVAVVPDTARRLVGDGVEVLVERGAGEEATFSDAAYEQAGARLVSADELVRRGRPRLQGAKPSVEEVARLRDGQVLLSLLQPLVDPELVQALAQRGVTTFSMDSIPRVTRAQPMDALSSQSTIAGYKAADPRGRAARQVLPHADDGRGHDPAGEGARSRRRRRRPAGDRDGPAPRRGRLGLRRPTRRQGAGGEPGCDLPRARRRGRRGRGRLRRRARRGPARARAGADRAPRRRVRRRDHDRADPGTPGPRADHAGGRPRHAPGLGDRRPCGGGRRQLRATKPGETIDVGGVTIVGLTNVPATMPVHASQMYSRNVQASSRSSSRRVRSSSTSRTRSSARRASPTAGRSRRSLLREQALLSSITIFVLSIFLGIELISACPGAAAHAAHVGDERHPRHRRSSARC